MFHFLNQSVLQDGHKKDISSSTLMKNWDLRSEIFHELTLLLIAECIDQPGKQWSCNIRNFWASEIYYFHSTDQMKMVAAMCPFIEEVLFMFEVGWHYSKYWISNIVSQDRFTCQLEVLSLLKHMKRLELWGGDFYFDNMTLLLTDTGEIILTRVGLNIVTILNRIETWIFFLMQRLQTWTCLT